MKLWSSPSAPAPVVCSFCAKTQKEVRKLIAGPKAYICDECLGLSNDIIAKEQEADLASLKATQPPDAQAVLRALDAEVVGQGAAKQALAAALFAHLVRLNHAGAPIAVPRVLVVGPRGSGKSALARALCTAWPKLVAYHADATRLTETGYVGENVENFLGVMLAGVRFPELAWEGLLVLDAVHHLAARVPEASKRDISGAEVQRDLLRLLDGRRCEVQPGQQRRHPQAASETFPCDRLLVVAIATLETSAGSDDATLRRRLRELGLLDELLSRFDVVVATQKLTPEELARVAERLVGQSRALFEALGGTLELTAEAAAVLGQLAAQSEDGAFALARPVSRLVQQALMEGRREVRIDAAAVRGVVGEVRVQAPT